MSAEKFKGTAFVTPKGIAKYAWLDKPDPYQAEKGKTEYKLRVLIDDTPENRSWVESVLAKAVEDAARAKVKLKKAWKNPFKLPEDQDEDDYIPQDGKDKPRLDEDHQGRIFFEIKTAFPPALIGTAKNEKGELLPIPDGTKIMSGDKVKVKFVLNPYEGLGSGVSFRLSAVQLTNKNSNFNAGVYQASEFGEDGEDDDEIPF